MHSGNDSAGAIKTQLNTPTSASKECGGNRSTFPVAACGRRTRFARSKSFA